MRCRLAHGGNRTWPRARAHVLEAMRVEVSPDRAGGPPVEGMAAGLDERRRACAIPGRAWCWEPWRAPQSDLRWNRSTAPRAGRARRAIRHLTPQPARAVGHGAAWSRSRRRAPTWPRARRSAPPTALPRATARASAAECRDVSAHPARERHTTAAPLPSEGETDMGLTDDAKGKAKEYEGKVTGDQSREAEGKFDQAKGDAKDAANDVKDAAGKVADRARDEADA